MLIAIRIGKCNPRQKKDETTAFIVFAKTSLGLRKPRRYNHIWVVLKHFQTVDMNDT